jgi:mRNA-degrading endonuclease RelE of RelBE toxin-antitoxin system
VPADSGAPYGLLVTRSAARQIAERLPEAVAAAALNFVTGDLLRNPRRVGNPLGQQLVGKHVARRGDYRIVYEIDDETRTVTVFDVEHRRDIYRL